MDYIEIQQVINDAADGDTIIFHKGLYDFSSAPLCSRSEDIGVLEIIDKSLTIKGLPGAIICGADSVVSNGSVTEGQNAFCIKNTSTDKDVTFMGLKFENFMRGILCGSNLPGEYYDYQLPNLRNLTIKKCIFSNIHYDAISVFWTP